MEKGPFLGIHWILFYRESIGEFSLQKVLLLKSSRRPNVPLDYVIVTYHIYTCDVTEATYHR